MHSERSPLSGSRTSQSQPPQGGSSDYRTITGHEHSHKENVGRKSLQSSTSESGKQSDAALNVGSSCSQRQRNVLPSTNIQSMDFHINIPFSAQPKQSFNAQAQPRSKSQPHQQSHDSSPQEVSSQHVELDSEQQQKVKNCLCTLESFFGI